MDLLTKPAEKRLQLEPLTAIELHILIVLAQTDDHAYDLVQSIVVDSEERFTPTRPGVSKALNNMQTKGWVELAERKHRHTYRLTNWGAEQLSFELDRLATTLELGRRRLAKRKLHDDMMAS